MDRKNYRVHEPGIPNWSLEPWRPDETETLFDVHRRAMGPLVEQVWGWDDADQRERFHDFLDPKMEKIVVGGEIVGMLDVDRADDGLFIGTIDLIPEVQGRGLGSSILNSLLQEADAASVPVRLQVLKFNTRARRWYEALGFGITDETDTHHDMERLPRSR
ncbi:hypothetical protein BH20CHL2_BH20CHL2_11330 [soil metagenome]